MTKIFAEDKRIEWRLRDREKDVNGERKKRNK